MGVRVGVNKDRDCDEVQNEVNREESERDEAGGINDEVDSTGKLMHI